MNPPSQSAEPPIPPDESQPSPELDATPLAEPLESPASEYEKPPPKPWWKTSRKALLGIGVFTGLTAVILLITGLFKMDMSGMDHDMDGHDMGGMEGHVMGGMSHDEMMGVDGAFNATPVTVEEVRPSTLDASVNYTGAIYPYTEVTVRRAHS